jgi:drug/metabolite transporter (DMT)-like permease
MAVFASLRGERPSRAELAGLLIGFVGVVVLNMGGDLRAAHVGALVMLLSPLAWALGSMWSRSLPLPPGMMSTAAQMLAGGAAMLMIGALRGESFAAAPSLRSLAAVGYLTFFGSIIAFSAYGYLLRNTRPALATSYAYVNPVIAIVLGVVVGGESVATITWVAAAVILVGVAVLTRAKHREKPLPVAK